MADFVLTQMTARDFLALPEAPDVHELFDGVRYSHGVIDRHQAVLGDLILGLCRIVENGEFRLVRTGVQFDDLNVVQPDLFWVSPENPNCHLIDNYWRGAPDLVIEILSPGTTRRDRDTKYSLYETAGVREYWIVDAVERYIEVYGLQSGKYVRQGLYGLGASFASPALNGVTLSVDALLNG